MAVRKFVITVTYERPSVTASGKEYSAYQSKEVDLVSGDIPAFLESLPDDINDHSSVWVVIVPKAGDSIAFVDGFMPEPGEDWGRCPVRRISECDGGAFADAVRQQAKNWASDCWPPPGLGAPEETPRGEPDANG